MNQEDKDQINEINGFSSNGLAARPRNSKEKHPSRTDGGSRSTAVKFRSMTATLGNDSTRRSTNLTTSRMNLSHSTPSNGISAKASPFPKPKRKPNSPISRQKPTRVVGADHNAEEIDTLLDDGLQIVSGGDYGVAGPGPGSEAHKTTHKRESVSNAQNVPAAKLDDDDSDHDSLDLFQPIDRMLEGTKAGSRNDDLNHSPRSHPPVEIVQRNTVQSRLPGTAVERVGPPPKSQSVHRHGRSPETPIEVDDGSNDSIEDDEVPMPRPRRPSHSNYGALPFKYLSAKPPTHEGTIRPGMVQEHISLFDPSGSSRIRKVRPPSDTVTLIEVPGTRSSQRTRFTDRMQPKPPTSGQTPQVQARKEFRDNNPLVSSGFITRSIPLQAWYCGPTRFPQPGEDQEYEFEWNDEKAKIYPIPRRQGGAIVPRRRRSSQPSYLDIAYMDAKHIVVSNAASEAAFVQFQLRNPSEASKRCQELGYEPGVDAISFHFRSKGGEFDQLRKKLIPLKNSSLINQTAVENLLKEANRIADDHTSRARGVSRDLRKPSPPSANHAPPKVSPPAPGDALAADRNSVDSPSAEIAEEDQSNAGSLRRSVRRKQSTIQETESSVNDTEMLFSYPPVNITRGELRRLEPDEFLNDTLIEFGLKLWMNDLVARDPGLADEIWVFNSFFYKKLSGCRKVEDGYQQVKKWTSKVDVFQKKYIIVPINENLHWYLAIIYNPQWVLIAPDSTEPPSTRSSGRLQLPQAAASRSQRQRPEDASSVADTEADDRNEVADILGEATHAPSSPARLEGRSLPIDPDVDDDGDVTMAEHPSDSTSTAEEVARSSPHVAVPDMIVLDEEEDIGSPVERRDLVEAAADLRLEEPDTTAGATDTKPEAEDTSLSRPCTHIFMLDSMGSNHPKAIRLLKSWLRFEALDKKAVANITDPLHRNVKVPAQPNFVDCGVYLLHFAETFVKAGDEVIKLALSRYGLSGDARDRIFEKDTLNHKRAQLKDRVRTLADEWRAAHPSSVADPTTELVPTSLGKRPASEMEPSETEQVDGKRERPPPGLASSTVPAKQADQAALMIPPELNAKGDEGTATATASPSPAPNTSSVPEEEDDEVVFLSISKPGKPQPKQRAPKKSSKSTPGPAPAQRLRG